VNPKDRALGMDRKITRRDFLNGVALTIGAAMLPPQLLRLLETDPEKLPDYYPPALTGLRGSHPGSFEVAHSLRDGTFWSEAGSPTDTGEVYDLIDFRMHAGDFSQELRITHARKLVFLLIRTQTRHVVFRLFVQPPYVLPSFVGKWRIRHEILPRIGTRYGEVRRFTSRQGSRIVHQLVDSESLLVEKDPRYAAGRTVESPIHVLGIAADVNTKFSDQVLCYGTVRGGIFDGIASAISRARFGCPRRIRYVWRVHRSRRGFQQ